MKLDKIVLAATLSLSLGCSQVTTFNHGEPAASPIEQLGLSQSAHFTHYDSLASREKNLVLRTAHCGTDVFERSSELLGPPKTKELRAQYYNMLDRLRASKWDSQIEVFYDHLNSTFYIVLPSDTLDIGEIANFLNDIVESAVYRIVPQCLISEELEKLEAIVINILDQHSDQKRAPDVTLSPATGVVSVYLNEPDWRLQNKLYNQAGGYVYVRYRPEIVTEFD